MRFTSILAAAICLAFTAPLRGQDGDSSYKSTPEKHGPLEVLSDTKGFNIRPYLREVIETVRTHWFVQIPNAARAKKGHVSIEFQVTHDGHISEVKYRETSGDEALDRAAYGAIESSDPLQALPGEFACQSIKLRFNFYYNPSPGDVHEKSLNDQVLPCVTSKIQLVRATVATVSPSSVQLPVGAKIQFLVKTDPASEPSVSWSVRGSGCEGSDCGLISTDGLYTAPARIPNPPTVSVTATLSATPTESASTTVTIVAANGSR